MDSLRAEFKSIVNQKMDIHALHQTWLYLKELKCVFKAACCYRSYVLVKAVPSENLRNM